MAVVGGWLAHLPAGIEVLLRWNNNRDWDGYGPHLRQMTPEGPEAPTYVLHDAEQGLAIHLYPRVYDGLLFVRAWGLDQPVSTDADLVSLALMCRQTDNPLLECTLGPDVLKTSSTAASVDSAIAQMLYDFLNLLRDARNEEFFSRHAPDAAIHYAGGVVPFQAFGEWRGCEFYFRYRGGWASLDVALPGDDPVDLPAWTAGVDYGETFDGALDFSEFTYIFCYLATRLQRATYPFRFAVLSRPEQDTDDLVTCSDSITLHGGTPEDAYARLASSRWSTWSIDPQPMNADSRRFPAREPQFIPSTAALEKAKRLIGLADARTRR
jgi:hypothetical protein